MAGLLVALLWPALASGQPREVRRFDRTMELRWTAGRARVQLVFPEVFTERLRGRLSSGFTSRLLVTAQLVSRKDRTPLARGLQQVTIRYDIWDERYALRIESLAGRRNLKVKSMDEVVQACARIDGLALDTLPEAKLRQRSRVEVRIEVNPTSPEQRQKVRQYLANPDGARAQDSPRSFFGSFSKIFVNEKDFQADAVFIYRSQDFEPAP
ncbi:MAG TPA: hypothetical protein PK668_01240 [Myxococcota bacterium]|nr:hypothetical protein [Myxococcota bacterium]HRY96726.1 hypothetical protein [Myxococcota bacterium]HSA23942.1 hypothetical protein [Myxococcota bacterium]